MSIFNNRLSLKQMWTHTPLTFILLILNTVAFIAMYLGPLFDINVYGYGVLEQTAVLVFNQYYRIFTAAFLHAGIFHFLSNAVIGLYVLTSGLERIIGTKKTALIYFFSMIFTGIAIVYLTEPRIASLGASGAIFGVLGCLLYLTIYRKDLVSERDTQTIRTLIFMNVVITFLIPNISIPAHIGGLTSGYLLSYLIIKRPTFKVLH